jgi:hypothetical protein
MRTRRLLIFTCLAAFAFVAANATIAGAESGQPAILLLSGKVAELEGMLKGTGSKFEALSKKALTSTGVTALVKGCLELESKPTDTDLCDEEPITLTGVKFGEITCRSENLKNEKDPIEEVLAKIDEHLDAEKSKEGVLQPLFVSEIRGVDGDEVVEINCGGVKLSFKGRIGCLLLPGLTNIAAGSKVETVCKVKEGDQTTGTCEQTKALCEELNRDPLLAQFGAGFEDAGIEIRLEGSFNKDIFIDD